MKSQNFIKIFGVILTITQLEANLTCANLDVCLNIHQASSVRSREH